jgi:hypothetical protein
VFVFQAVLLIDTKSRAILNRMQVPRDCYCVTFVNSHNRSSWGNSIQFTPFSDDNLSYLLHVWLIHVKSLIPQNRPVRTRILLK